MTKATGSDRKVQEITIFHDVAKALTSSLDLDSILQTIIARPRFHPSDHHGKNGGVFPPRYLVTAYGG